MCMVVFVWVGIEILVEVSLIRVVRICLVGIKVFIEVFLLVLIVVF